MLNEYYNDPTRGPLDIIHFALACIGFFTAVGGVLISCVPLAVCGVIVLGWGLAYFSAN